MKDQAELSDGWMGALIDVYEDKIRRKAEAARNLEAMLAVIKEDIANGTNREAVSKRLENLGKLLDGPARRLSIPHDRTMQ